jgi:acyl-CoA reductase-like NAD-dependent aldehyde dehydrogenase
MTTMPAPTRLDRPASVTDELLARLAGRVSSDGSMAPWQLTEVYTGEKLVELPQSSPADIERAFAAARVAQAEWARRSVEDRLAVFKRAHSLFLDNAQRTADLIQVESGKNRRMAIEETCDPPMVMGHYLKRAKKLLAPTTRGGPVPFLTTSTEVRVPKGVVGIIGPWNFPFATGISDAISALMAGNGIVLKPDNKTALSPLWGIEMLEQAGLPTGLFQVVCGEGGDVGPTFIDNANYVMFTGSTATGRVIGERCGRNLIGCCLELGGKNPMIVLEDADLDEVVQGAIFGAFGNTGQICMHIERMYLPRSRYEEFKAKFVRATEALDVRAAYDFGPDLGSLVSVDHMERVKSHVDDAVAKGATVLTGGRPRPDLGPAFFEPRDHRDLRPGREPVRLRHRRRGRGPGQRHRLRPQRVGLGHRPRRGHRGRPAHRVRQRQHQRHPRHRLRVQGHPVRRREGLRCRCPARRPGPAEVHRRAAARGAQEAGHGCPSGPGLRRVRQGDAQRAEDDAEAPGQVVTRPRRTASTGPSRTRRRRR